MSRTEKVELTTLCLIRKGDEILLQNRVKADWQGYTLPGGHLEPGESIVESVIREIREETGLTIRAPKLCGIKQFPIDGGRYLVFLFKANCFDGEIRSSQEGEVSWIRRQDIARIVTVADLEKLITVMERDDLTEFQYVVNDGDWSVQIR